MRVRLMTPGPTDILPAALEAMGAPIVHHRTEPFREILRECREGLKSYFRTQDDVVVLAGSGTAGMEAVVVNLLSPGDKALVASCGKFGDRWAEIATCYGIATELVRTELGAALDPDAIAERLAASRPRALFVTANETSVGVKSDLQAIVAAARRASPDTLVAADAITAIGAYPFETGAWGLDAVVCGSQKALSLPPGLAFVALSSRAREAIAKGSLPRYYLNLEREFKKQTSGETGFTPAISLVVGLRASLRHYLGIGLENVWRSVALRAGATRAGLEALGIRRVPVGAVSESVTAAWVPEGTDGVKLVKEIEAQTGIKIAGGQGELKGKIVRIAHFGPVTDAMTLEVLQGIEDVLARGGATIARGAAATAARRELGAAA